MNRKFEKERHNYLKYAEKINTIVQSLKEDPWHQGTLMKASSFKGIRYERITRDLRLLFSICEECDDYRDEYTIYCQSCPEDIKNKVYLHTILTHKRLDRIKDK